MMNNKQKNKLLSYLKYQLLAMNNQTELINKIKDLEQKINSLPNKGMVDIFKKPEDGNVKSEALKVKKTFMDEKSKNLHTELKQLRKQKVILNKQNSNTILFNLGNKVIKDMIESSGVSEVKLVSINTIEPTVLDNTLFSSLISQSKHYNDLYTIKSIMN